jgi:hypothetical protein
MKKGVPFVGSYCIGTSKCTVRETYIDLFFIVYYDQHMHNYSQIITLLHISPLMCHSQGAFNQYLAKLHKYFKGSCS